MIEKMGLANLKKIINILILIIAVTSIIPLPSRATNDLNNGEIIKEEVQPLHKLPRRSGIKIEDYDKLKDIYKGSNTVNDIGGKIIGVAQLICYGAAVMILLYKGVQFMKQAPEARAEMKKELINYAIGAIILFAIGTLIKIIGNISFNTFYNNTGE